MTVEACFQWEGFHPSTYSEDSVIFDARSLEISNANGGFIFLLDSAGKVALQLNYADGRIQRVVGNTAVPIGQ